MDALPAHGTPERYRRQCRCMRCRLAMNEYRNAFNRRGRPFTCRADEVREHVLRLAELGIGNRALAKLSGTSYTTVRDIRQGRAKRVRTSTAQKILGVTADERCDGQRVPKEIAVRLVERLTAQGLQKREIARALGYESPCLAFLTSRRKTVHFRTVRRLEILTRLLVRDGYVSHEALAEVGA